MRRGSNGTGMMYSRPKRGRDALVGRRHVVGHVLPGEFGQRIGRGDLHLHVDRLGAHIERAAEDVGKAQDVVDLVGVVGAAGRDDDVVARLLRLFRRDLRIRIRHREDDRIRRHRLHHLGRQRALGGEAEEDVGADHRLLERAERRVDRMGRLPLVHAGLAAAIDDALGVAQNDVSRLEPHRLDQVETGDPGRARAVAHEPRRLDVAPGQVDRIDHARRCDDRGAVLVVVKDGDVHHLAQALLDDEALRRLDVLEIDAAERRPQEFHRGDEFLGVLGIDLEIDRIDVGEALEQHRLAFHHRLRGERAEVAEAEDGGSVGDHRHHVAPRGVVVDGGRIGGDRLDRNRDARRVGERQVALRRHRLRRGDLELARTPARMEQQRLLIGDRGAFDRSVGLRSHRVRSWIHKA